MNDVFLARAAVKIAGSIRALEELSGTSRHSVMRLLNGKTKRLQSPTREKLERFVNAE
ncbi:hypothetical protein J8F10_09015 [Gemmata sp. G18]|uniref:XRE family transcriptional regulator n=1 Tax=Gemmata palustris TaxID=2822762 RepID=A0ABS5BNW8_9BACT|nr:hypothetical protein [Gemmata palustris]MBP3955420.1 hypothetical protein [Gemmata palustris]